MYPFVVTFSMDFVFSNWLLMYLSDKELKSFLEKVMGWLRPGGFLFFRESCNHRSGTVTIKHPHSLAIIMILTFISEFNPKVYFSEKKGFSLFNFLKF